VEIAAPRRGLALHISTPTRGRDAHRPGGALPLCRGMCQTGDWPTSTLLKSIKKNRRHFSYLRLRGHPEKVGLNTIISKVLQSLHQPHVCVTRLSGSAPKPYGNSHAMGHPGSGYLELQYLFLPRSTVPLSKYLPKDAARENSNDVSSYVV
jgi:hypothetical protein